MTTNKPTWKKKYRIGSPQSSWDSGCYCHVNDTNCHATLLEIASQRQFFVTYGVSWAIPVLRSPVSAIHACVQLHIGDASYFSFWRTLSYLWRDLFSLARLFFASATLFFAGATFFFVRATFFSLARLFFACATFSCWRDFFLWPNFFRWHGTLSKVIKVYHDTNLNFVHDNCHV